MQQNNSDQAAGDDDPQKCKHCGNTDDGNGLIECERCSEINCSECVELTLDQCKQIQELPCVHWYCKGCEESAISAVKTDRDIEEKCNLYMSQMTARIDAMEKEIDSKADRTDLDQLKDRIENLEKNQNVDIPKEVKTVLDQQGKTNDTAVEEKFEKMMAEHSAEEKEREKRKRNLILFGVPEPNTNLKHQRLQMDNEKVAEICNVLIDEDITKDDIEHSMRKGRKSTDNTSVRPVVITLTSEELKRNIIRNAQKLNDTEDYQAITINLDMTVKEREEEMKLKVEARKLTDSDKSGKTYYKVRGPPGDRTIVRYEENKNILERLRKVEGEDQSGNWIYKIRGPPWKRTIIQIKKE